MGRQPDIGGLRPALHRARGASFLTGSDRQHGAGCDLLPGAGSDRWSHHHELRLHQCNACDPGCVLGHAGHRHPDCLQRRPLRGGHRSPDPRRGFRLSRLHRDLTDLCLLHLPLLRHRGGDHRQGAGIDHGTAADDRLYRQCGRDHSPRHPRGDLHQSVPSMVAAILGGAAACSLRLHRSAGA